MKYFISLLLLLCIFVSCEPSIEDRVAFEALGEVPYLLDTWEEEPQEIERIIIHTDATYKGREFETPEELKEYFLSKWSRVGYWVWIDRKGRAFRLSNFNADCMVQHSEMTWGARGYNQTSVHIAYSSSLPFGNTAKDTRTEAQKVALENIVRDFWYRCGKIPVIGHYHVTTQGKTCPNFNVEKWAEGIKL